MPAPEARAAIGPVGRIVGVFFSPKGTFEDIVRKPSWLAPFASLILLSILACFVINQRTNWLEFQRQQIEKNPATANLPADQKEQRIEIAAKYSPAFSYVFGTVAPAFLILVTTLAMWGGYKLLGGARVNFATSFAITSHAFLTGLISTPLLILILYLKPVGTVDLENPIAANVAAFLPEDSAKWLVALGKSFDLFVLWTLILLAIGFAATSPRKLKGGKSFSIAFSVWAAFAVLRVGVAFIFS